MVFGLIDFINLLPLKMYFKRCALPSYTKSSINHHKSYPSRLNAALKKRQIHAAIISSIASKRRAYRTLDIGICAHKRVLSVLVEKNSTYQTDAQSATSNMLSKVLGLNGKVIIGDKALCAYIQNGAHNYYDMCEKWYEMTALPFCFARYAYTNSRLNPHLKRFARRSNTPSKRIKIPQYILDDYSQKRGVSAQNIKHYLHHIYYTIGYKENKALNLYIKKSKLKS